MSDYKEIDLASLPSVAFVDIRLLPHDSGVYFAFDIDGRVLYVGQTRNLHLRWKVHHRIPRLTEMGCVRLAWHLCAFDVLEEIEYAMIQHYDPPLNEERRAPSRVYTAPYFPRPVAPGTPYDSRRLLRKPLPTDPVCELFYHLVWRSEYDAVFQDPIKSTLVEIVEKIGPLNGMEVLALDVQPDHIHCFVSFPPAMSIAQAVKLLKGISARQLRLIYPQLRKRTRADRLWAPSYFVSTAGNASAETIRQYMESQDAHHAE